jgi:hypothetical protein
MIFDQKLLKNLQKVAKAAIIKRMEELGYNAVVDDVKLQLKLNTVKLETIQNK